ncbi:MAG: hypothetical protein NTW64_00585 [Candidatus Omnitrophica bacterium]|nr:hypothetical protein [Candidatus Omnitrophota bacterium]
MNFELYGLLYLVEGEKSLVNAHVKNFQQQIKLYVQNAIGLSASLRQRGIKFTLLTNRLDFIFDALIGIGRKDALHIEKISFPTKVPSGIRFYSAHFVFDVFRYFSSLSIDRSPYIGFCDLDVRAINEIPECLINIIRDKIPMCYDITDQVIPAYGHDIIIRDMESISCVNSEGRWFGGEFITGSPAFFLSLISEIDNFFEKYISKIDVLCHVGSEVLISVALEQIRRKGTYVADAGTLGIVGRYWSGKTLHHQKPFDYYKNCFLLHLPGDKKFLASMANIETLEDSQFIKKLLINKNSVYTSGRKILSRLLRK